MRILWLINIPLPEASMLLNEKPSPFGGWLLNASKQIGEQEGIELSIAFPKNNISNYKRLEGQKITYYAFRAVRDRDIKLIENNFILEDIVKEVKPDFVHIYGTEMAHTLAMVNVCQKENIETIISIQGLVSIIEKHMLSNLPWKVVYGVTIRNLFRKDNVVGLKSLFYKRGRNEVEAIEKTNHVIGRTTWDKACCSQINSKAQYHFCNETLREEFYKHKWSLEKCEHYSIFISQASYPIKGLHFVLEAMPLIVKRFPNTKLYIAGPNITKSDTLKEKLKKTSYAKYIIGLIDKYGLKNNVVFIGLLDEKQMCERYLKSHVFVCPSSIENSPNSLGEAMILGVPCVASHVGGVATMLKHQEEGFLYQHDASYMLAHYVCEIFEKQDLALIISKQARDHALKTHNRERNTNRLLEIYKEI